MSRIWRFVRYVLADELHILANRADPDMIVKKGDGGIYTSAAGGIAVHADDGTWPDFNASPLSAGATMALFYGDDQLTPWEPYTPGGRITAAQPLTFTHVMIRTATGLDIPYGTWPFIDRTVDADGWVALPNPLPIHMS